MVNGFLKTSLLLVVALVVFGSLTEAGLILYERHSNGIDYNEKVARRHAFARIRRAWYRGSGAIPVYPPFESFANRSIGDENRLSRISKQALLKPDSAWSVENYILPKSLSAEGRFTVGTNALGFRDPEHRLKKPDGVIRVLCLGSSLTFGHGVNDDETFPRQLEVALNQSAPQGKRFEVWNAGRESETAITGLAFLKYYALDLSPDLVVVEYGPADVAVYDDGFRPALLQFRSDHVDEAIMKGLFAAAFFLHLDDTKTMDFILSKYLASLKDPGRIEGLSQVMRAIGDFLAANRIPALMINQPVSPLAPKEYPAISEASRIPLVDIRAAFLRSKHPEPLRRQFFSQPNWTEEFGDSIPSYALLLADMLSPNKNGNFLIAHVLSKSIRERLANPAEYSAQTH